MQFVRVEWVAVEIVLVEIRSWISSTMQWNWTPWWCFMWQRGKRYRMRRRGPNWTLGDTLEEGSSGGCAVIDGDELSEVWRMEGLMVSKAALRLRWMRMLRFLTSEERKRSLVILSRAVSVLWFIKIRIGMFHTCHWQRGGVSVGRLQHVSVFWTERVRWDWPEVTWDVRVESS